MSKCAITAASASTGALAQRQRPRPAGPGRPAPRTRPRPQRERPPLGTAPALRRLTNSVIHPGQRDLAVCPPEPRADLRHGKRRRDHRGRLLRAVLAVAALDHHSHRYAHDPPRVAGTGSRRVAAWARNGGPRPIRVGHRGDGQRYGRDEDLVTIGACFASKSTVAPAGGLIS